MKDRVLDGGIGIVAIAAFLLLLIENTAFGDAHPRAFNTANIAVLALFAADVLYRLLSAGDRRAHLRAHWYDLAVVLPLLQYLSFVHNPTMNVVIRQCVILVMLLSRSRKAVGLLALLSLRPAQAMTIGFLGAIGVGSILLMLPVATVTGDRTALIDALFTATSAVCVTGLIVQDTATHFSRIGQSIILGLIQIGGLGIMTFSVSLVAFSARQMDVKQRASLQDALDADAPGGIRTLIRFIVLMTFGMEAMGAVLLFLSWRGRLGGVWPTAYHALFHSVSAFCNAGFSTFSDSLVRFRGDVATNVVICLLIIAGGLGFMVIRDLTRTPFPGGARGRRKRARMRVQTRIALTTTLLLLVGGAVLVYVTERKAGLAGVSGREQVLLCVFQSVTPRTAGFNTMDIAKLAPATLLLTVVLMFIGGSPGSTAGGIKTTTLATLWVAVRSSLQNRAQAEIYRRTLPRETVQKAVTVFGFAIVIVLGFALALMAIERQPFADVLFETVSAFGTVGLSTGITPHLTVWGKLLVTALMYIGRLGPLTIAYALVKPRTAVRYEYPNERVMIG